MSIDRRSFLKTAGAVVAGAIIAPARASATRVAYNDNVRLAIMQDFANSTMFQLNAFAKPFSTISCEFINRRRVRHDFIAVDGLYQKGVR